MNKMTVVKGTNRWWLLLCVAYLLAHTVTSISAEHHPIDSQKDHMLYESSMADLNSVTGWAMEGPGKIEFQDGWMEMYSPNEKMHHVFWCPKVFPEDFIVEWEAQNLHPEAGLCIVFFCARGINGEDIFDQVLPKRDGTFRQYTKGKIVSYHISYYANTPGKPNRPHAHLRKNNMFALVSKGPPGIFVDSASIHKMRLLKKGASIKFYVDDRLIIDWIDDGKRYGPVYGRGKIGLRQMRWTKFRYRNFRVWSIKNNVQQSNLYHTTLRRCRGC